MAKPLRFNRCGCDSPSLGRIPRSWWMRLFKSRRLYVCNSCNAPVFAIQRDVEVANWQAATLLKPYLPTVSDDLR